MRLSSIVHDSLSITFRNRALWVFGLFAAAGGGASGGAQGGGEGAGASAGQAGGEAPAFLAPLVHAAESAGAFAIEHLPLVLGGATALGLGALALHLVSEGALIEGVSRLQREPAEPFGLRRGFRLGLGHAGVVLRVKALCLAGGLGLAALVAAPFALGGLGTIPLALGIALGLVALLAAVPAGLSLYFAYALGLRVAVLENRNALDAFGRARRLLHGRLLDGLKLLLTVGLGRVGGSLLVLPVVLPLALAGLLGWALGGLLGAVLLALAILLPAALLLAGLLGAWQSSVWTLGYLAAVEEGR